ncbi:OmpA-like transmembrane domain-containing protein [Ferrimonas sediminum]|uniref:OmpA-like transmembrane domain-containing protein n=2 Tax=Ferrimonas sediminum TaxID=718193 RepID=A0A1G8ZAR0_9GAMM|nr:OmpA-like transmembrane domain-containing protein [Ferrimonas sediminum]
MTRELTLRHAALLLTSLVMLLSQARQQPRYPGCGQGHSNYAGICPQSYGQATDCGDTDFSYNLFTGYRFNDDAALEQGDDNLGQANKPSTRTTGPTATEVVYFGQDSDTPDSNNAGKLDTIDEFPSQFPEFTATFIGDADKSGNVDYNQ